LALTRKGENVANPKMATNPGLQKLRGVMHQGKITGGENDPAILAALDEDAESTARMDTDIDVEKEVSESMEQLTATLQTKAHPIGNGTTVPMPYDGEPTTEYTTCSVPIPNVNRGCVHAKRCILPALSQKKGGPGGPFNMIYKDLRSGLIKSCHCTEAMRNYLRQPQIVFLDIAQEIPGESFMLTRHAEYRPLPDGRQPTPGPNQPRTPIELSPRKTRIVCVPPEGVTREFQLARRRGDFDRPARKTLASRR